MFFNKNRFLMHVTLKSVYQHLTEKFTYFCIPMSGIFCSILVVVPAIQAISCLYLNAVHTPIIHVHSTHLALLFTNHSFLKRSAAFPCFVL